MSAALLLATALAALIQLRGEQLGGGTISGSAVVPLERASGGDTPVLSFASRAGAIRLLLDTGASSTMVTPALAERLGLPLTPLPPERFALAGGGLGCGSLSPQRTRLPDLTLQSAATGSPGLRLSGAEALVLPVAGLPAGIDGVLGAPSLRLTAVRVDPARQQVSFGAEALRQGSRHGRQRLRLRWHRGVPLVGLRTPLGPRLALADTGAEGLFLTPALARRLPPLSRAEETRLVGFCGEQTVQRQLFAAVELDSDAAGAGKTPRNHVPLEGIITENPVFEQLGVEAIAGQELLRRRIQLWRLDTTPPSLELW
ncbi:MAG: aspartyl protease family protein [Synechococcaceae cyanobacterium]|nr:aspartyl protease family protein [Synechococcaceae cyanobacterium]